MPTYEEFFASRENKKPVEQTPAGNTYADFFADKEASKEVDNQALDVAKDAYRGAVLNAIPYGDITARGLGALATGVGGLLQGAKNVIEYSKEKKAESNAKMQEWVDKSAPEDQGIRQVAADFMKHTTFGTIGMPVPKIESKATTEDLDKTIQVLMAKGQEFHKAASKAMEKDDTGTRFVKETLGDLGGGLAPGLVEWFANIPWAVLNGAAKAKQEGRNELWGALTEGAIRYLGGQGFKMLHEAGRVKPVLRPAGAGVVGAGMELARPLSQGRLPSEEEVKAAGTSAGALALLSSTSAVPEKSKAIVGHERIPTNAEIEAQTAKMATEREAPAYTRNAKPPEPPPPPPPAAPPAPAAEAVPETPVATGPGTIFSVKKDAIGKNLTNAGAKEIEGDLGKLKDPNPGESALEWIKRQKVNPEVFKDSEMRDALKESGKGGADAKDTTTFRMADKNSKIDTPTKVVEALYSKGFIPEHDWVRLGEHPDELLQYVKDKFMDEGRRGNQWLRDIDHERIADIEDTIRTIVENPEESKATMPEPEVDKALEFDPYKAGWSVEDISKRYKKESGEFDILTMRDWAKKSGLSEDDAVQIYDDMARKIREEKQTASDPISQAKKLADTEWEIGMRQLIASRDAGKLDSAQFTNEIAKLGDKRRQAYMESEQRENKFRPTYLRAMGMSIKELTPEEAKILSEGKPEALKTIAERGGLKGGVAAFIHTLDKFFVPQHGLPTKEAANRWERLRQEAKGKEWKGIQFAQKFTQQFKDLPKQDKDILWEFMNGDRAIEDVPLSLQQAATRMRTIDNVLGRMLMNRGLISEETYQANKGKHIKYIYNVYSTGKHLQSELGGAKVQRQFFQQRMDKEFYANALKQEMSSENFKNVDAEIASVEQKITEIENTGQRTDTLSGLTEYRDYLLSERNKLEEDAKGRAEAKAKALADQVRTKRGFIKDPVVALTQSIAEVTKTAAMADYFKKLGVKEPEEVTNPFVFENSTAKVDGRKLGLGAIDKELRLLDIPDLTPEQKAYQQKLIDAKNALQENEGKPPGDYVKLEGERYGDLNGAYVHKVIANDIRPLFLVEGGSGIDDATRLVRNVLTTGTAIWKSKSVALNPPTMFRNMISNFIQMNMSGIPVWKIPLQLKKAAESMLHQDEYYKALGKQGTFQGNFSTGELAEIMGVASDMQGTNIFNLLSKFQNLTKYYGKIDDLWKLTKFIDEKENGLSDADAAREANKWGMDYSLASRSIKTLRAAPLGAPFFTYQYKIAPLIAESLRRRPWVIAKYLALPYLLQQAITRDMTDDDAKKFIDSLPEYIKNGQILLIPGKNGMGALDISFMVPWGNWYQVAQSMKTVNLPKAFKQLGVSQGPVAMAAYALSTGRDLYSGKDIVSAFGQHRPKIAATDWMKYLWTFAMPPFMTERGATGKIIEHERFGKNPQGTPTEWYMAWPRLVGANIYPVSLRAKALKDKMDIVQVKKEFIKRLSDKTLTEEERLKLRQLYKEIVADIKTGENK